MFARREAQVCAQDWIEDVLPRRILLSATHMCPHPTTPSDDRLEHTVLNIVRHEEID